MGLKKIEIELLTLEKAALEEENQLLKEEIALLKVKSIYESEQMKDLRIGIKKLRVKRNFYFKKFRGYKEAYLNLYSDLYDLQSCDDEELPLSVQALVESYGMNYKYLNPDF